MPTPPFAGYAKDRLTFELQRFSWAMVTSTGKSTIVADTVKSASGTSVADTILANSTDNVSRAVYGNAGADKISLKSGSKLT